MLALEEACREQIAGCRAWVNEGDALALSIRERLYTAVCANGEHRVVGEAPAAAGLEHDFSSVAVFGDDVGERREGSDIYLLGCHRFDQTGVFRSCGCFHRNPELLRQKVCHRLSVFCDFVGFNGGDKAKNKFCGRCGGISTSIAAIFRLCARGEETEGNSWKNQ